MVVTGGLQLTREDIRYLHQSALGTDVSVAVASDKSGAVVSRGGAGGAGDKAAAASTAAAAPVAAAAAPAPPATTGRGGKRQPKAHAEVGLEKSTHGAF